MHVRIIFFLVFFFFSKCILADDPIITFVFYDKNHHILNDSGIVEIQGQHILKIDMHDTLKIDCIKYQQPLSFIFVALAEDEFYTEYRIKMQECSDKFFEVMFTPYSEAFPKKANKRKKNKDGFCPVEK